MDNENLSMVLGASVVINIALILYFLIDGGYLV